MHIISICTHQQCTSVRHYLTLNDPSPLEKHATEHGSQKPARHGAAKTAIMSVNHSLCPIVFWPQSLLHRSSRGSDYLMVAVPGSLWIPRPHMAQFSDLGERVRCPAHVYDARGPPVKSLHRALQSNNTKSGRVARERVSYFTAYQQLDSL
ncbi:uncharacterized protein BKA78DRAFT_144388 [Phyllosticta capitalensis]|uniref:uncharacterized protein n=1 Tax=Phyllosticta capitalensis TaxID=121624 RepID=UPI00312FE2B2